MTATNQLQLLFVNFVYGIILFFACKINYFFIKNEVFILRIIITLLFAIDFSVLYLILIYKINYGIFNSYYILALSLGFSIAYCTKLNVKLATIAKRFIDFIIRK